MPNERNERDEHGLTESDYRKSLTVEIYMKKDGTIHKFTWTSIMAREIDARRDYLKRLGYEPTEAPPV